MEFQSYLSQPYQGHESFLENIIFPIFGEENYDTKWDVELLDSEELKSMAARTGIRSILRCGTLNTRPTPVDIFDITVSDRVVMNKNRVGVQAIIRRIMDTYSGAFLLIHYENDLKWDWRFTFCQMRDRGEFTDNKRYTFLLGPNQACKTAAQNFGELLKRNKIITIKDIVGAFDVEALSKEFFDKYKAHYERFVEYITGKRYDKDVEKTIHEPHPVLYPAFGSDDKSVRDYVKLLMGRIIFLHFLQKKGWLGVKPGNEWGTGDEKFMLHLYEDASSEQKNDFIQKVLNPLFFDALDKDRRGTGDLFDSKVLGAVRIPYLNGGLFEKNESDSIQVQFEASMLGELFTFFSEYNFTIDENDPSDAQVGIDPEMLGKIFENLLEDNKDKGAYYTPKEIVQYICQESLTEYLIRKTGLERQRIHNFVQYPDACVTRFNEHEQYALLDGILSVKICDPAIGSGAFPIGLLNELVRCKEAIYGDERGRADIKREIIRDNIYGVDIERGAVDIARLRFWLSLIVDEETPEPLPNLDYKIMQGNSLLEKYQNIDLSHLTENVVGNIAWSEEENLREKLQELLKAYFDCSEHGRKEALQEQISTTIKEQLSIIAPNVSFDGIDLTGNKEFFLWHTWFSKVFADGGFDICLGNPPYVEHKKLKGIAKNLKHFQMYSGTADYSVYFIEHGFNLLKQNGVLSYITTNKFFNTEYGQSVRRILSAKQINQIINFEQVEVFDGVLVSSVVINIVNGPVSPNNTIIYERFFKLKSAQFKSEFVARRGSFGTYPQEYLNEEEWSFSDTVGLALKKKIEEGSQHLEDIEGVNAFRGVTTGYNPAFIVDKAFVNSLSNTEPASLSQVKHLLQGRNIKKWYYEDGGEYLLFIPWHFPLKHDENGHEIKGASEKAEAAFVQTYPELYKWLLTHKEKLRERNVEETGIRYEWYALQRCAASYYEEFEQEEKIVWGLTADSWAFALDIGQHYTPSNAYILTSKVIPVKYILGVINSKVMQYYFSFGGVMTAGGAYTLKAASIAALPFKIADDTEPVESLVERIISLKSSDKTADVSNLERELNKLVYQIYDLNDDDIALIENTLS